MIDKKTILKLAEERINELNSGLFIVELSVSASNAIHLELDKTKGYVSINECMSVSRNIEHNLDRETEDFELHVSSAGLDKPFRLPAQYQKNIGKTVKVVTIDGKKQEGLLTEVNDDSVVLETSRKIKIEGKKKNELVVERQVFPMKHIKETKVVISFK
jgi:ribosome maturation factor RimP